MRNTLIFLLLILAAAMLDGCSEYDPVSAPGQKNDLLLISSFETGMEGWDSPGPPKVKITSFAPKEGGNFSVLIKSQSFGGTMNKIIAIPEGKNIYRFSFWSSVEDGGSSSYLYLKSGADKKVLRKKLLISNEAWTKYAMTDTILADKNDSLQIVFIGSNSQDYTWVDLCILEKIN